MTAIFSRHFLSARGELRSAVECCRTPLGHILEHTLGHTLGRTGLQLCNRSALQIERRLVCVCVWVVARSQRRRRQCWGSVEAAQRNELESGSQVDGERCPMVSNGLPIPLSRRRPSKRERVNERDNRTISDKDDYNRTIYRPGNGLRS